MLLLYTIVLHYQQPQCTCNWISVGLHQRMSTAQRDINIYITQTLAMEVLAVPNLQVIVWNANGASRWYQTINLSLFIFLKKYCNICKSVMMTTETLWLILPARDIARYRECDFIWPLWFRQKSGENHLKIILACWLKILVPEYTFWIQSMC